jgi:WD40 repeat protein
MAALLMLASLLAACTSGGPSHETSPSPTYHPKGQLIALVGRFGGHFVVLDLRTGKTLDPSLPQILGFWGRAWPAPDGRLYAMPLVLDANTRSQMYLFGGNGPPRRVGPPIRGGIGFQVAGGYAVAWTCPGVFLLNLSRPARWERVSDGCGAALSPDGRHVAFETASGLWVTDVPRGKPREVLRFADLDELGRAHIARRSLEQVAWGAGGVAAAVGDSSNGAVVVWNDDRRPVVDIVGRARIGDMEWQPGGSLLAFIDHAPEGEVFSLDARTGEERQLAELGSEIGDLGGLTWSPDGRVVGAALSPNLMALVDPGVGRVGTLVTPGVPVAWVPEAS